MQGPKSSTSSQDSNVTLVLVIVVLVFTVCQTPALATQLMWSLLSDDARRCGGLQYYFGRISNLLVVVNSAANFPVYLLFNTRFRAVLGAMIGRSLTAGGGGEAAAGGGSRGPAAGASCSVAKMSGTVTTRVRLDDSDVRQSPQHQHQLQPLLGRDTPPPPPPPPSTAGHVDALTDTTLL